MQEFDPTLLRQLYIPPSSSHKGQNGKVLLIGGSHLFHASTLWALEIASKVVDMVFYASVPENNEIVQKNKEVFRNGIVVPQMDIENYIQEADAILLGPGMERVEVRSKEYEVESLKDILAISNQGEQTYYVTKYLLQKYPQKKWVIDAGALQMLDLEWLKQLGGNVILTPHHQEFETLKSKSSLRGDASKRRFGEASTLGVQSTSIGEIATSSSTPRNDEVELFARKYNCIVLLKGETDIICSPEQCVEIPGGNAGMTKGGTGDVLAGLVTALAAKNDLFLSACAGSYINKKAGESLFKKVGYYFNSTDLVNEIPKVMKDLIGDR